MKKILYLISVISIIFLSACDNSIVIDFQGDGVNLSQKIIEQGQSLGSLPTPIQQGFVFDGWYYDLNLTVPVVSTFIPEDDITVYARWIQIFKITFNTNKGSNINTIIVEKNNSIDLNQIKNPSKEFHRFNGWYLDNELTLPSPSILTPDDDITLYAKWLEAFNTVSFNTNNGIILNSIQVDEELPFDLESVKTPTKDYHEFVGWYLDAELTIPAQENMILEENITLFAKWAIKQYSITFISNGGSDVSTIKQEYGTNIIEPEIRKVGFIFVGWYVDSDFTQKYNFSTVAAIDVTLHAKWEIETYTISYRLNGGVTQTNNPYQYTIDSQTINLIQPTKSNYVFGGWYKNSNFSGEPVSQISTGSFGNLTLHARWLSSFDIIYIHFSENGTKSTTGDGYQINLGPLRTPFLSRPRNSLSLRMEVFSNEKIELNGFYVFSDNSSSILRIRFKRGELATKSTILYFDYDIIRPEVFGNTLLGTATSLNSILLSSGWRIRLTNSTWSPLPGSIFLHEEVANALADLILATTENYFRDKSLPPIR
jgi:uncharacterized repeat protein (TIGR02543 family)